MYSVLFLSCKNNTEYINVVELSHFGSKTILDDYSNKNYNSGYYDSNSKFFTITKVGNPDTIIGVNVGNGVIFKVAVTDILISPQLIYGYKGLFSFINDSLLLYSASLSDYSINGKHDKILSLLNIRTKKLSYFGFQGLPVKTDLIDSIPLIKSNKEYGSELAYYSWTFQFDTKDSSMFVSLAKTLTEENELLYNNPDKVWIAKVSLGKDTTSKFKTLFPKFHSFGDSRHRQTTRPNSAYYSDKILIGYPVHSDIYEFDKTTKNTKVLHVSSGLVPNELKFSEVDSISAYNTGFIGVWKNQNGNGFFRVAQTKSRTLIGTEFKNYLDFRSILIWKKDNGEVAECYLDKPIWSVAYAHNDTLFCNSKITKDTKQLTLEKYLITGTKKVNKQKYLNEVLGVKP